MQTSKQNDTKSLITFVPQLFAPPQDIVHCINLPAICSTWAGCVLFELLLSDWLVKVKLTDISRSNKQTVESRLSFCGRSEKFLNVVITRLVHHLQAARDKWNAALYEEDDDEEGEDVETDCSSFRPSASKKKMHPFEIPLAFKKTPPSNEDQLAGGSSWCSAFEVHCAFKRGRCFFCDADSSQTEVGHLEGRDLEHSQDLSQFWM